jgi:hypothetical protein
MGGEAGQYEKNVPETAKKNIKKKNGKTKNSSFDKVV